MQLVGGAQRELLNLCEMQDNLNSFLYDLFKQARVLLCGGAGYLKQTQINTSDYNVIVSTQDHTLYLNPHVLFISARCSVDTHQLDSLSNLKVLAAPINQLKTRRLFDYCKRRGIYLIPFNTQPMLRNSLGNFLSWSNNLCLTLGTIPFTGVIALAWLLQEPWRHYVTGLSLGGKTGSIRGPLIGGHNAGAYGEAKLTALSLPVSASIKQITVKGFTFYDNNGTRPEKIGGHLLAPQVDLFRQLKNRIVMDCESTRSLEVPLKNRIVMDRESTRSLEVPHA